MNPKGKKLMAIFAHPDDAEIWAGGLIPKLNRLGLSINFQKIEILNAEKL